MFSPKAYKTNSFMPKIKSKMKKEKSSYIFY